MENSNEDVSLPNEFVESGPNLVKYLESGETEPNSIDFENNNEDNGEDIVEVDENEEEIEDNDLEDSERDDQLLELNIRLSQSSSTNSLINQTLDRLFFRQRQYNYFYF